MIEAAEWVCESNTTHSLRSAPMIGIRTSIAAEGLVIASAIPTGAEIVASKCRLLSYDGPITSVETFRCDFMQRGGNVAVNSAEHEFSSLASEHGKTYIRINSIPLCFTRTSQYTLKVTIAVVAISSSGQADPTSRSIVSLETTSAAWPRSTCPFQDQIFS